MKGLASLFTGIQLLHTATATVFAYGKGALMGPYVIC